MAIDKLDKKDLPESDISSDESDWEDAEPEEEETVDFISLLDDSVFPSLDSMLQHCREKHNFDFLEVRHRLGLDFLGTVRLVNFVRQSTHDGACLPEIISAEHISDDRFFKPVIEDDALIMALTELDLGSNSQSVLQEELQSKSSREAQLEDELEKVKAQFASYRSAVEQTLDQRWGEDVPNRSRRDRSVDKEARKDESQYYWESYASNGKFVDIESLTEFRPARYAFN
ncbi:Ribosomal protein arginine N-methyltransferase rmt3 [Colletotrichum tropicale]|nr:Ribosomal protein arginine N-methyltransferase rmt3 [Colletotrichum tropicale]